MKVYHTTCSLFLIFILRSGHSVLCPCLRRYLYALSRKGWQKNCRGNLRDCLSRGFLVMDSAAPLSRRKLLVACYRIQACGIARSQCLASLQSRTELNIYRLPTYLTVLICILTVLIFILVWDF